MAVSLGLTGLVVIKNFGGFASRKEAEPHKKLKAHPVSQRLTAMCCGQATECKLIAGEDRLTAAVILVEVLKGSRAGYVKMPFTGSVADSLCEPSLYHDTQGRQADSR